MFLHYALKLAYFFPIPWLRNKDFMKDKNPCHSNLFMSSRICLPTIYDKIYKASMFCFQNYVFTMVRMLDVDVTSICTWGLHRHLNVECFALAVP